MNTSDKSNNITIPSNLIMLNNADKNSNVNITNSPNSTVTNLLKPQTQTEPSIDIHNNRDSERRSDNNDITKYTTKTSSKDLNAKASEIEDNIRIKYIKDHISKEIQYIITSFQKGILYDLNHSLIADISEVDILESKIEQIENIKTIKSTFEKVLRDVLNTLSENLNKDVSKTSILSKTENNINLTSLNTESFISQFEKDLKYTLNKLTMDLNKLTGDENKTNISYSDINMDTPNIEDSISTFQEKLLPQLNTLKNILDKYKNLNSYLPSYHRDVRKIKKSISELEIKIKNASEDASIKEQINQSYLEICEKCKKDKFQQIKEFINKKIFIFKEYSCGEELRILKGRLNTICKSEIDIRIHRLQCEITRLTKEYKETKGDKKYLEKQLIENEDKLKEEKQKRNLENQNKVKIAT